MASLVWGRDWCWKSLLIWTGAPQNCMQAARGAEWYWTRARKRKCSKQFFFRHMKDWFWVIPDRELKYIDISMLSGSSRTGGSRIMQKPGTWISICFSSLEEESKADIPTSVAGEVETVLTAAASWVRNSKLYLKGLRNNRFRRWIQLPSWQSSPELVCWFAGGFLLPCFTTTCFICCTSTKMLSIFLIE